MHSPGALLLVAASALAFAPAQAAQFFVQTVDSEGVVGTSASLRVDADGTPHIAYFDVTHGSLKYAHQRGPDWIVETVAPADVTANCSLALEANGNPLILVGTGVWRSSASQWVFEHAAGFAAWAGSLTTASDGTAHACVLWSIGSGLYRGYVSYANRNGAWMETELESSGAYFLPTSPHCSIAVDSRGAPHLCFTNDTSQSLRYFGKTTGPWASETIGQGNWGSIALDAADVPNVTFYDTEAHVLRLAVRTDHGWTIGTIDDTGDVGRYSSLGFGADGTAHVAYYDRSSARLKYALRLPNSPAWAAQAVDTEANVGEWASLAVDARNEIHIAYYDAANTALRYATTRVGVAVKSDSWSHLKSIYGGTPGAVRPRPE